MNNILFPTDFSPTADTAFQFAVALAKANEGHIDLLHTYRVPLDYHLPAEMIEKLSDDEHKSILGLLKKIIANFFRENPSAQQKITIEPVALQGFTSEVIAQAGKDRNSNLIIMGTQGASGLEKYFLGSMTTSVIDKTDIPVLAIPEGAVFKDFKNIIYASDFSPSDFEKLKQLHAFAKHFGSKTHCVHISDDEDYFIDDVSFNLMKENFFKEFPETQETTTFKVLLGNNVEDGLKEAIDTYEADLLAMTTEKQSFFDRIFGGSDTKQMAYSAKIPLLAFHE